MHSYCPLNCQELWLPTGDLCKIGPIFIFILKWAPGRGEWEERVKKGAGRVSWGVSLQDVFFSGVAALSCPCSCKHPLTLFIHKLHVGGHLSSVCPQCPLWGESTSCGSQAKFTQQCLSFCSGRGGSVGRTHFVLFCAYSEPHCSSCHLVITSQVSSRLQNLGLPIQPKGNHWSRT